METFGICQTKKGRKGTVWDWEYFFGTFLGWRLRTGNYPIDAAILLLSWRFGISNGLMGLGGGGFAFFSQQAPAYYIGPYLKKDLCITYTSFCLVSILFLMLHFGIRFFVSFVYFETLHHHLHVAASGFGAGVRAVFLFLFIILLRLGLFKKKLFHLYHTTTKKRIKKDYTMSSLLYLRAIKKKKHGHFIFIIFIYFPHP
jgi:hypothetical protein